MNKPLQRAQLITLMAIALLSPIIRQMPTAMVRSGGSGAWVSALLALPVVIAMGALSCDLLRERDLAAALEQSFGKLMGKALTAIMTLWLLFYLGFVLRSSADRFVTAVYPEHSPWVFVGVLAAMVLLSRSGSLRQMGRLGQVAEPFLLLFFLLLPVLVLPQVDITLVKPERGELPGLVKGIFPVADTLCVGVFAGFLEAETEGQPRLRELLPPIFGFTALIALLCVSTVGLFGANLTGELYYPFFVLLRNVELPGFLERVEAALVAQWLSADFILAALLLRICEGNLAKLGLWKEHTWLRTALCMAPALTAAVLCADSSYALLRLTENVVPKVNAALVFGVVPLCWAVGKVRS